MTIKAIKLAFELTKLPYTSPSQVSYGMSVLTIFQKLTMINITDFTVFFVWLLWKNLYSNYRGLERAAFSMVSIIQEGLYLSWNKPHRGMEAQRSTHWWTVWLTHWGRDKMDTISQTTFSNVFSWMKMYEFRLRFHWNLFLEVQLKVFQH